MNKTKSASSANVPKDIVKKTEFELMLELVDAGLWRTNNLASALGVNKDTITDWKRRPEAIDMRRNTIKRYLKRRIDAEKVLKELDMETDVDEMKIGVQIEVKGLEKL